ncbi:MAG: FIST C-terminal domain-containing protein [Melioribacteraceae bacterium]|nr:FIST C-terminal domain-containing protein [Melioribacteraceae bacterium]
MKAKSIKGTSAQEIKNELSNSMTDGFKPTLAIIFISIKQDRAAVYEIINNKGIDIIGATSSGEFINGYESEGGIVILLFDLNRNYYSILFEDIKERSLEDATQSMIEIAFNKFEKPAFILITTLLKSDGGMLDGEGMVRYIEKLAGPDISMFGGMAGDDLSFSGTWIFAHDKSTDYGMAALVLDETKIELHGLAFSGWKPMGVPRTVTKSEGNLIYSIDNRPALEIYLHLLGQEISSSDDQIDFFDRIGVHYPFQIERENREPKMCNPIGYDKEKQALICESDVPQDSTLRFSTPPDFDIIETVIDKADKLKNEHNAEADALLIFSCAGRLSALGPMAQQENEGIQKVWNVPMAGFYTYGEYGKGINGKHEIHSTTCSWVALKEK